MQEEQLLKHKSLRMPRAFHELKRDYKMLLLPKQLEFEGVDNYIDFIRGRVLVVDSDLSRKKMHLYQSIAQRLMNQGVSSAENNAVVQEILSKEANFDMRNVVLHDILPFWKVEEFIQFFKGLTIITSRQLSGQYKHQETVVKRQYKDNYGRNPSVKHQFRSNKANFI